jgi:hypothetical protein
MWNGPPLGHEQQPVPERKRQDIADSRPAEIDIVDDLGKFSDEAYAHGVCFVAKPLNLTSVCCSSHRLATSTMKKFMNHQGGSRASRMPAGACGDEFVRVRP